MDNSTTKEQQRQELESQMARFKNVHGGEIVTYAAQPAPDRKPWRKRKNLLDKAFDQEIERAEKEVGGRIGMV